MRKYFLIFALMASFAAYAQNHDTKVEKRTDWYIGANAGVQVFMGVRDKHEALRRRIAPVGGITFGKWLANWFALDLNATIAQFKGAYKVTDPYYEPEGVELPGNFKTDILVDRDGDYYRQRGTYMNFYLNAKFNLLSSDKNPYKKDALMPYIGAGVATVTSKGSGTSLTMDAGLQYRHYFTRNFALQADVFAYLLTKGVEAEPCDEHTFHGTAGVTLGFVYSFGKSKAKAPKPVYVEKIIEKPIVAPVEKVVEKTVQKVYVVTFAVNSYKLENVEKELAGIPTGSTVDIVAYASPEGNVEHNKYLSWQRAEAVSNYLRSRGVNVASVSANGADSNHSNRIALVILH